MLVKKLDLSLIKLHLVYLLYIYIMFILLKYNILYDKNIFNICNYVYLCVS
jgi:hypothetical protein